MPPQQAYGLLDFVDDILDFIAPPGLGWRAAGFMTKGLVLVLAGTVALNAPRVGGKITRVETLNRRYLYALDVESPGDTFDLCPADACLARPGAAAP